MGQDRLTDVAACRKALKGFAGKRVLVIGDLMLDEHIFVFTIRLPCGNVGARERTTVINYSILTHTSYRIQDARPTYSNRNKIVNRLDS